MTSNAAAGFAALAPARYISLETYRRNGAAVRTPVWFAADAEAGDAVFYVYTPARSGKVKRLRGAGKARIARCDARGRLSGEWLDARAELVTGQAFQRGMRFLDRKYRPWKQLIDLGVLWSRQDRAVIAIRPSPPDAGGP